MSTHWLVQRYLFTGFIVIFPVWANQVLNNSNLNTEMEWTEVQIKYKKKL